MEAVKSAISTKDIELFKKLLANESPSYSTEVLKFIIEEQLRDIIKVHHAKYFQGQYYDDEFDCIRDVCLNNDGTYNNEAVVAFEKEKKEFIKVLLAHGADVNSTLKNEEKFYTDELNVFSFACRFASASIVQMMVDHGADFDFLDGRVRCPTQQTFLSGDRDKINLLLDRGLDAEDIDELELLLCAASSMNTQEESILRLLQLGADINIQEKRGMTRFSAFLRAVENGNPQILTFFIDRGSDVNGLDAIGQSAIELAAYRGQPDIVKILLERGANVHKGRYYPLEEAARKGPQEAVKLLLDYGANVNGTKDSKCPIVIAAFHGHEAIVGLLLDRGAKRDDEILHTAVKKRRANVVKLLLDREFDPNCIIKGMSPLAWAITKRSGKCVELLLNYGAQVDDRRSEDGMYPLHYAADEKNEAIILRLLDRGADMNAEYKGRTALTISIEKGFFLQAKILIRQMILLKSQDAHVSEKNLNASNAIEKLCEFQSRCESEVELLKSEKFDDSTLSYFDIFNVNDINKLASLASNENILKLLNSDDFVKKFPIYGGMIVKLFDKGISKNKDELN